MDGPTDKSPGPFFGPADSGLRTLDLSLMVLRTALFMIGAKNIAEKKKGVQVIHSIKN